MKNFISEKQLEANRKNAKKGGVKTIEGKKVSKYNSLKHGILSDAITEDEKENFEELYNNLIQEFRPETTIEFLLVERIALYQIRLYRAARAEATYIKGSFKQSPFPDLEFFNEYKSEDEEEERSIRLRCGDIEDLSNLYLRYEKTLENRLYRALRELERIQRARRRDSVPPPLAVDVDLDGK